MSNDTEHIIKIKTEASGIVASGRSEVPDFTAAGKTLEDMLIRAIDPLIKVLKDLTQTVLRNPSLPSSQGPSSGSLGDNVNLSSIFKELNSAFKTEIIPAIKDAVKSSGNSSISPEDMKRVMLDSIDKLASETANKVSEKTYGVVDISPKLDQLREAFAKSTTGEKLSELTNAVIALKALGDTLSTVPVLLEKIVVAAENRDISQIAPLLKEILAKKAEVQTSINTVREAAPQDKRTMSATGALSKEVDSGLDMLVKKAQSIELQVDTTKAEKSIEELSKGRTLKLNIDTDKDNLIDILKYLEAIDSKLKDERRVGIDTGLSEAVGNLDALDKAIKDIKLTLNEFDKTKAQSFEHSKALSSQINSGTAKDVEALATTLKKVEVLQAKMNGIFDKSLAFPEKGPSGFDLIPKERAPILVAGAKNDSPLASYRSFARSPENQLPTSPSVKGSGSSERTRQSLNSVIAQVDSSLGKLDFEKINNTLNAITTQSQKDANDLAAAFKSVEDGYSNVAKATLDRLKIEEEYKSNLAKQSGAAKESVDATEKRVQAEKQNTAAIEKDTKAKIDSTAKTITDSQKSVASNLSLSSLNSYKPTLFTPRSYTPETIRPGAEYNAPEKSTNIYENKVFENAKNLSKSLERMQEEIYNQVSSGLKNNKYSNWKVVGKDAKNAFDLRGRQWGMDVADEGKLQAFTGKRGSTEDLLLQYRKKLASKTFGSGGSKDVVSDSIEENATKVAEWVNKSLDLNSISKIIEEAMGKELISDLKGKNANTSSEDIKRLILDRVKGNKDQFAQIFGATVGASDINKILSEQGVVRTLSLPAAKVTSSGNTVLETQGGRQRALTQYADYKTGHERAYDVYLEGMKARKATKERPGGLSPEVFADETMDVASGVRAISRGQEPTGKYSGNDISKKLITALASQKTGSYSPGVEEIKDVYKQAAVPLGIEKQRITAGTSAAISAEDAKNELFSTLENKAAEANGSVDVFINSMDKAGVSAYKVVSSLDKIEFSNFYDVLEKSIKGKLNDITKNIDTSDQSIREYEKSVKYLEGLMPIVEDNSPRRGMHQGDEVKSVYQTSKAYNLGGELEPVESQLEFYKQIGKEKKEFDSDEQKEFIKKMNRRNKNLFYESENLGKLTGPEVQDRRQLLAVGQTKGLSSLGLPESQAGDISKFGQPGEEGRMVSMYSGNLRALSPFGEQFQQTGRNISNVSAARVFDPNAVKGVTGIPSQFPSLVSSKEKDVIQSGRYGKEGYGFNVTAELAHTASTFEDQIVVSGDLAKAVTTMTKKLVRPAAYGADVTSMKEGPLKDDEIMDVSREIMSSMGIVDKYKGRADKAFLSEVKNEASTIRGESVEVQTAKLAEVFMNHFGRKLTTRYGSKGLSISPGSPENMAGILEKYQGEYKSIKVLTEEERKKSGLGVAMMPKSMGELASDLIENSSASKKAAITEKTGLSTEDLSSLLRESGNKFILDIFSDARKGLVTKQEANANKKLFDVSKTALGELGIPISSDKDGIENLKSGYTYYTDKDLYKAKPIDVRISSYGAGKRGLQTEALEMITGNLASTGAGGATTIKDEVGYKGLLGKSGQKGKMSDYSKALGYSDTGKSTEEIRKSIEKMYGEKAADNKEFIDSLVKLEENSSFYVDVIDELGKKRKGLVGKKFVQIIEEAKGFNEWSKGEIEGGEKGLKLNIPAYAAYTTIFGVDSAMMKQINSTFDSKQGESYNTILTYLINTNDQYKEKFLKNLSDVKLSSLTPFEGTFGSFKEGDKDSLIGTIFDVDKYPGAFKTQIPSTKNVGEKEDLYIPSSAARAPFQDPMVAGGYGVPKTGRMLQNVLTRSKSLEAYQNQDTNLLTDSDRYSMSKHLSFTVFKNLQKRNKEQSDEAINNLIPVAEKYATDEKGTLDEGTVKNFPELGKASEVSQKDYLNAFKKAYSTGAIKGRGTLSPTDVAKTSMKELLVGKQGSPLSIFGSMPNKDEKVGFTQDVSSAMGLNFVEMAGGEEKYQAETLKKRKALEEAKENYYKTLAQDITGKKGAIADTLFTRKVPAIMAKATNATVDRTKELSDFGNTLSGIESEYASMKGFFVSTFSDEIKQVQELRREHSENLKKYKTMGMPILKQHELGVPRKLAEKINVNYTKKYNQETGAALEKPQEVTTSFGEMLSYAQNLRGAAGRDNKKGSNIDKQEIFNYIDKELLPYVESVRYPFTGTSSVQPYKATLLENKKGMNEDTLMVPGTPEMDMDKFDKMYKSVVSKRSIAEKEREALRVTDTPESNATADELTKYINALNKALSDVLPRYVAHSQKLDYDGDAIEIHSAETKEAREDIRKHFDLLVNDVDSTSARFKAAFTYDAKQPTQGDVPLAFAAKASSKKFKPEHGFEYLQKPFTTESLDYLSKEEKIRILANKRMSSEGTSAGAAVNDVMKDAYEKAGVQYKEPTFVNNLDESIKNAVEALNDVPEKGLISGYIREELSNSKLDDAVIAQLFKVHTGKDTEGLTSLMRAYESKPGFGGGETSLAERTSSGKIDQDFMLRERHTQMNEMMRFGIQKGMDVKHAGEQPVAGEMAKLLTSGPNATISLIDKIKTSESYSGLKEFLEENEKSLNNLFGKYKTEELRSVAKQDFVGIQGADTLDRPELTKKLVEKMGFEGFLRDLQAEIERQAIDTLSKQENRFTGELNGIEGAKKQLNTRYNKGQGISLSEEVMAAQNPLYALRTGASQENAGGEKFKEELPTSLSTIKRDTRSGAYTEMTKGFSELINKKASEYTGESLSQLSDKLENSKFEESGSLKGLGDLSKKISGYESFYGVSQMTDMRRQKVLNTTEVQDRLTTQQPAENQEEYIRFVEEQELLKERVRRLKSVTPEIEDFSSVDVVASGSKPPKANVLSGYTNKRGQQRSIESVYKSSGVEPPDFGTPTTGSFGNVSSGPIPVHLVSIDSGLIIPVSVTTSQIQSIQEQAQPGSDIQDRIDRLKDLAARASGGANELKDATFETMYRASALHGGGAYPKGKYEGYEKETQIKEIQKSMRGEVDVSDIMETTALMGTALHDIIEKSMLEAATSVKDSGKPIIEKFVELTDDTGKAVTGHIDAVLTDVNGKMTTAVDIKTVDKQRYKEPLEEAIKKTGSTDYDKVKGGLSGGYKSGKVKYKLEEVRSQLNFYMAALQAEGENVTKAEAHFYDRLGEGKDKPVVIGFTFDKKLFDRDMAAIEEARKRIIVEGRPISGPEGGLFAKTGSLDSLRSAAKSSSTLTSEEINDLLSGSTAHFNSISEDPSAYKSKGAKASLNKEQTVKKIQETQRQAQAAGAKGGFAEAEVLSPYEGFSPEAQLKNLDLLRKAAKMMQKDEGVDFDKDFKNLPEDIQKKIEGAKTGDVKAHDFYKYIQDKQDSSRDKENPDMAGPEIAKAWKLFKDAQIESLMKKAEEAESYYNETKSMGDTRQTAIARQSFETAIGKVQEQIKKGAGQRSDIYSKGNVWKNPDIAKAAGVYMSPSEIRFKSAIDIEGDSKLYNVFESITKDLSGKNREGMKPPVDKARYAIKELTDMNDETVKLMENGKLLERMGAEITDAWDFKKGLENITRLRESLELFKQYNVSDSPLSVEKKNIESTIKMLKDAENKMSYMDLNKQTAKGGAGEWGATGVIPVPKWLDADTQESMHKRNISKVQEYMKRPEAEGGAKVGEHYSYKEKVFDQSGAAVKNIQQNFAKYKEVVDTTGATIGKFTTSQNDLNESLAGGNKGLAGAVRRAVMWGAASTIVYGGFSKLKESISILAEVETGMAQLRMIMNPLTSDFDGLQNAAVRFAKEYGTSISAVLKGMTVFAQQGLTQAEVIDRARTSTLASNVTTLSAKDATEALTAAMAVFKEEGENSMRFLDAWSEVETRTAITAGDLGDAIKKTASAAKNSGVSFDELNGIVATIGSTTRQTGKEVGTSLRFVFGRLGSKKAPEELGKLGISSMLGSGENKGAFDVLSELAGKWDTLTSAQKLNIAQAIGGTRQYNSLLVLMDNWKDTIDGVTYSMNSKGSAERKNQELMKTYTKQVEQTKAAFVELEMSVGKVVFPVFKTGLQAVKTIAEALSNIPTPIKAAGAAALLLFTYLAKGATIIDSIKDFFTVGKPAATGMFNNIKEDLKIGAFEVLGAGAGRTDTMGLKTVTPGVASGVQQGKQLSDFNSSIGKATYLLFSAGKEFNSSMGPVAKVPAAPLGWAGKGLKKAGNFLSTISSTVLPESAEFGGQRENGEDTTWGDLGKRAAGVGASAKGVREAIKAGALKGSAKILGSFVAIAAEIAGLGASAAGIFVEGFSKKLGAGGDLFKKWASENAGFVEALAPMLLTIGVLSPAIKELASSLHGLTQTSQDYEKAQYGVVQKNEDALKSIRNSSNTYKSLSSTMSKLNEKQTPESIAESKRLGTYKNPLITMIDASKKSREWANGLGSSNSELVAGYDKLGNVVLKASDNFAVLFNTLERSKIKEMAATNVDIASKHIEALTKKDGSEKWKSELKDFVKEVPMFGDLIADQIKISPALAMEKITTQLNALISAKNKNPFSTVYDDDIKKIQEKMGPLKDFNDSTYTSFKKSLASTSTDKLNSKDITEIFTNKNLKEGYKFMVDVEPRLQVPGVKGNAKWQDVMGNEVMRRAFPKSAASFDVTKELAQANADTAGRATNDGTIVSGDIVTFKKGATKDNTLEGIPLNAHGDQAIVEYKKDVDGVLKWMYSYFNTETGKIESRIFDKNAKNLVDSIIPTKLIEKDLSDRIDLINEFVAGASAGLRGITPKDFKKDYNLGERFFSDISSTTLIQGGKGFTPEGDFGESPFQASWAEDFKKYYEKPMEEYKRQSEELKKAKLAGIEDKDKKLVEEYYDRIIILHNVLKNNQVVMQYRSAFADLTKTIEANTRATAENLEIEKLKLETTKESFGLLKGHNKSLADIDFGVTDVTKLTSEQRLVKENPEFERLAKEIRLSQIKSAGLAENIAATGKTTADLNSIQAVSTGFGATLTPEEFVLDKYKETEPITEGNKPPEIKIDTKQLEDNTKATADNTALQNIRLQKLIENFSGGQDAERLASSITDLVGQAHLPSMTDLAKGPGGLINSQFKGVNFKESSRISEALNRVAEVRDKATSSGDSGTAITANSALEALSKKLVDQEGIEKAQSIVDKAGGAFKSSELTNKAIGLGPAQLISAIREKVPTEKRWGLSNVSGIGRIDTGEREEFDAQAKAIADFQKENAEKAKEPSTLNAKNVAGATAGVAAGAYYDKEWTSRRITDLDKKLEVLRAEAKEKGATVTTTTPEGATTIGLSGEYKEKENTLLAERGEEYKRARFYGTVQAGAAGTGGAIMLAKSLGFDESASKKMGVAGGAFGIYAAAKADTGLRGEDLPPSFKKFGEELSGIASRLRVAEGGVTESITKKVAFSQASSAAQTFMKDFTEESAGIVPKEGSTKPKDYTEVAKDLGSKAAEQVEKNMLGLSNLSNVWGVGVAENTEAVKQNTEALKQSSEQKSTEGSARPEEASQPKYQGGRIKGFASGGGVGSSFMFKGPGSGTSDSISAELPTGGFIIPAAHASQVQRYLEGFSDGGMVPVNVSNGEYFISPEKARQLGPNRLEQLRKGDILGFASGGAVEDPDKKVIKSGEVVVYRDQAPSKNLPTPSTTNNSPEQIIVDTAKILKAGHDILVENRKRTEDAKNHRENTEKKEQSKTESQEKPKPDQPKSSTEKPVVSPQSVLQSEKETLSKLINVLGATTTAKYIAGQTEEKTRLATLGTAAKDENALFMNTMGKRVKELQEIYNEQKDKDKAAKLEELPTRRVSLLLDANKQKEKTAADIQVYQKTNIEEQEKRTITDGENKAKGWALRLEQDFTTALENMDRAVKEAKFAESIKDKLKIGKGVYAGMTVPQGTLDFGLQNTRGMDKYQLLQYKTASDSEKNPSKYRALEFNEDGTLNTAPTLAEFKDKNYGPNDRNVMAEYSQLEKDKQGYQKNIESAIANKTQAEHVINSDGSVGDTKGIEKWNAKIKENSDKLAEVAKIQEFYTIYLERTAVEGDLARKKLVELNDSLKSLYSTRVSQEFSLENQGFGGNLKGTVSGLSLLPTKTSDLTNEQYAWTKASDSMKMELKSYSVNQNSYRSEVKSLDDLTGQLAEKESDKKEAQVGDYTNSAVYIKAANSVERLKAEVEKQIHVVNKHSEALEGNSSRIKAFNSAMSALKEFEIATKDVSTNIKMNSELGGFAAKKAITEMYGGSSSRAPVLVTPQQQVEAARVGMTLNHGQTDSYKMMEFELRKSLATATGEAAQNIREQLSNLPGLRRAHEQQIVFRQEAEKTTQKVQPLENLSSNLAKLAYSGDLNKEDAAKVEALIKVVQDKIKEMAEETRTTLVSPELDTKKFLDEIISQIPGADKDKNYDAFRSDVSTKQLNELISIRDILKAIAEDQGVDVEKILEKNVQERPKEAVKVEIVINESAKKWATPEERGANIQNPGFWPGTENKKSGGMVGTMLFGPGTGTSDSISAVVPHGSYIIQSRYAQKANNLLNGFSDGGMVPVNVSNGEMLLTPDEVKAIGGRGVAGALNSGQYIKKFASGGSVFGSLSDITGEGIESLEDYRLEQAKEATSGGILNWGKHTALQGGATLLELGARVGKGSLLDPLSAIERASAFQAEKGTSAVLDAGSDIVTKSVDTFKSLDKERLGNITSSLGESFSKDMIKGGLGTTSTILNLLSSIFKPSDVVAPIAKMAYKIPTKSLIKSLDEGLYGVKESLSPLIDSIHPYKNVAKELNESLNLSRPSSSTASFNFKPSRYLNKENSDIMKSSLLGAFERNPDLYNSMGEVGSLRTLFEGSGASISTKIKKSNSAGLTSLEKTPRVGFNFNKLFNDNKELIRMTGSSTMEDMVQGVVNHEFGHALSFSNKFSGNPKYSGFMKELSEAPAANLTEYALKYKKGAHRNEEAFAEMHRLYEKFKVPGSIYNRNPKDMVNVFYGPKRKLAEGGVAEFDDLEEQIRRRREAALEQQSDSPKMDIDASWSRTNKDAAVLGLNNILERVNEPFFGLHPKGKYVYTNLAGEGVQRLNQETDKWEDANLPRITNVDLQKDPKLLKKFLGQPLGVNVGNYNVDTEDPEALKSFGSWVPGSVVSGQQGRDNSRGDYKRFTDQIKNPVEYEGSKVGAGIIQPTKNPKLSFQDLVELSLSSAKKGVSPEEALKGYDISPLELRAYLRVPTHGVVKSKEEHLRNKDAAAEAQVQKARDLGSAWTKKNRIWSGPQQNTQDIYKNELFKYWLPVDLNKPGEQSNQGQVDPKYSFVPSKDRSVPILPPKTSGERLVNRINNSIMRFEGKRDALKETAKRNPGMQGVLAGEGSGEIRDYKSSTEQQKEQLIDSWMEGMSLLKIQAEKYKNASIENKGMAAEVMRDTFFKVGGASFERLVAERDKQDMFKNSKSRWLSISKEQANYYAGDRERDIKAAVDAGWLKTDSSSGFALSAEEAMKQAMNRKFLTKEQKKRRFAPPNAGEDSDSARARRARATDDRAYALNRQSMFYGTPGIETKDRRPEAIMKQALGAPLTQDLLDMFNERYNMNNGSRGMLHTGGVASQSGTYLLEKGELVVSKNFKNGGAALSDQLDTRPLNNSNSVPVIDSSVFDELKKAIKELKSIELKVDLSKKMQVDVEGINVGVDVKGVSIPVDVKDAMVKVDIGDVKIPVDIDGLKIPVDIGEATVKVDTSSLEEAINKLTSIQLKTPTTAVGADKEDQLSKVLDNLNSQVLDLRTKQEEDLKLVNSKLEIVTGKDNRIPGVIEKQQLDAAFLEKQIGEVNSSISNIVSAQKRKDLELKSLFAEQEAKFNTVLTHLYSVSARGGLK